MMTMRGRMLGTVLFACALGSGGCGSDDEPQANNGTGGAAGAGGTAGAASCDTPPAPTGDATFDKVAAYFYEEARAAKAPGGALVVYSKGKLHKMVFGSKKEDECDPVTLQTRFNATRMSHMLTGLAAIRMSLGPSPLVDLDKPIYEEYMPELIAHLKDDKSKERGKKITLRHLLTHTSGYWPVYWSNGKCPDIAPAAAQVEGPESLAAFFEPGMAPVLHEPGTMWMVSDPATALAARVLEKRAGKPYPQLMKERIAEPAGLGLTFDPAEAFAGDFGGQKVFGCGLWASTWGANMSADDLGKLVESYAVGGGDGVLSEQEVKLQLDAGPGVASAVKGVEAPMGGLFAVQYPPYGRLVFRQGHGANPATGAALSAAIEIAPDQSFGFAFMLPVDLMLGSDVVQEAVRKEYLPEFKPVSTALDPASFGSYEGDYQSDDGSVAKVEVAGPQLKVTLSGASGTGDYTLSPKSFVWWGPGTVLTQSIDEDWFGLAGVGQPNFRFYRDSSGQATGFAASVSANGGIPIPGPFIRSIQ